MFLSLSVLPEEFSVTVGPVQLGVFQTLQLLSMVSVRRQQCTKDTSKLIKLLFSCVLTRLQTASRTFGFEGGIDLSTILSVTYKSVWQRLMWLDKLNAAVRTSFLGFFPFDFWMGSERRADITVDIRHSCKSWFETNILGTCLHSITMPCEAPVYITTEGTRQRSFCYGRTVSICI